MTARKKPAKRNGKLVVPLTLDDALRAALETPPPKPDREGSKAQEGGLRERPPP